MHTSYLCSCEDYTQTVGATHSVAYLFLGSYPILLCHIKKEKKTKLGFVEVAVFQWLML